VSTPSAWTTEAMNPLCCWLPWAVHEPGEAGEAEAVSGEIAWSWRTNAGVEAYGNLSIQPEGRLKSNRQVQGGNRVMGSPGRARHKPSNHCAGKAGCFATSWRLLVTRPLKGGRGCGCGWHPAFLAPSS
jgi:hypothetical protein